MMLHEVPDGAEEPLVDSPLLPDDLPLAIDARSALDRRADMGQRSPSRRRVGAGPGLGRALELIRNAALAHQPDLLRVYLS